MKIVSTIARYLLGLTFTVLGLNGFLQFLPAPPPTGVAAQWLAAMSASHYMVVVFLSQILAGLLLLSGKFVPLALAILAPILVNILDFHITMAPSSIGLALLAVILWILVFVTYRANFRGLFESSAVPRSNNFRPL